MTEAAILIADQTGGDPIATREAYEDIAGATRYIERVDFSSGRVDTPWTTTYLRGDSAAITTADGVNLASLASDLTSNLLDPGDCAMVLVSAYTTLGGATDYIDITPILFDAAGTGIANIIGILETKRASCSAAFREAASSGQYRCNLLTWDVSGAHKIGFHITEISTSNGIKLKAAVI